jgi:alpha-L-rhamnosidase
MSILSSHRWRSATGGFATALLASGSVAVTTAGAGASAPADPAPTGLRVGGAVDPLGIDDTTPDLQWRAAGSTEQTAFQARVASSAGKVAAANLWQSGRISSADQQVEYDGKPLGSRDTAVWQVRTWSGPGGPSAWSDPALFEMGLLEEQEWAGEWVTDPRWVEPLHQDVALGDQRARFVP